MLGSEGEVRGDAAFGEENAGARFQDGEHVVAGPQGREARADGAGGEDLVRQAVGFRAVFRAGEDDAVRRANHEPAGLEEERGVCGAGEFIPEFVGALDDGDVAGMFEVGFADDPGLAVGRAHGVRRREAVESEHALAASREMIRRGAAHGSESDDDDVVAGGHESA